MLRLLAVALCALCLPAAALADSGPNPSGNPDYPYQYTWNCKNGESVTTEYDHQLSDAERASERAQACPDTQSTQPATTKPAPKRLRISFDKQALLAQTLADLRANHFTIRLRCTRACTVRELVQFGWDLPNGKARILSATQTKKLPGGRFVNVVVKLTAAQLKTVRGASADVHLRGFDAARASDGGQTAIQWVRTCPVHVS